MDCMKTAVKIQYIKSANSFVIFRDSCLDNKYWYIQNQLWSTLPEISCKIVTDYYKSPPSYFLFVECLDLCWMNLKFCKIRLGFWIVTLFWP